MGCWQSAYELSDEDLNKDYLINFIENLKKENKLNKHPLLVINGNMINYDSLKKCDLKLFRKDIDTIYAFFKSNDPGAKFIYGDDADNGVILLSVKKYNLDCE